MHKMQVQENKGIVLLNVFFHVIYLNVLYILTKIVYVRHLFNPLQSKASSIVF